MADAEFEAFKADIAANGLMSPIWRLDGKVLDGRNRLRACRELRIAPTFEDFPGTEEEALAFVDSQNLHRRHLTAEFRRERVAELRAKGMSVREIAETMGVGVGTVHRDMTAGVPVGTPEPRPNTALPEKPAIPPAPSPSQSPPAPATPPKVTGRDGKQYAASKPPRQESPPARTSKSKSDPAAWAEVVFQLNRFAELIDATGPLPEEIKPWELVESLEKTGRSLLRRAQELRKRHHL